MQGELIASNGDCDDTTAAKNPAQAEICDSLDNNCNNQIDEGNICLQTFCQRLTINIPASECLALQSLQIIWILQVEHQVEIGFKMMILKPDHELISSLLEQVKNM